MPAKSASSSSSDNSTESKRMVQLRRTLDTTLDSLFPADNNYADEFGDLRTKHNKIISSYVKQVMKIIPNNVRAEFDVICNEHSVVQQLDICDQQEAAQPVLSDGSRMKPLSTLKPEKRFISSAIEQKERQRQRLRDLIAKTNDENAALEASITKQRAILQERLGGLQTTVNTVNSGLATVESWNQAT